MQSEAEKKKSRIYKNGCEALQVEDVKINDVRVLVIERMEKR